MTNGAAQRRIIAMGGGGFSDAGVLTPLDRYVLSASGTARPRVCFLGTASGDADRYAASFYRSFGPVADVSDLRLFGAPTPDDIARLTDMDVIVVGGGNTASMIAVWRAHGVDRALRRAWETGTVLAGVSAGAICWFEASLTDSFGTELAPLADGLGLVRGSACPHFDGEPARRGRYIEELSAGHLPAGYGIDDGVALHFSGGDLHEVVSEVPDGVAHRFEIRGGTLVETRLEARLLTDEPVER
jgi:dipeptidase E